MAPCHAAGSCAMVRAELWRATGHLLGPLEPLQLRVRAAALDFLHRLGQTSEHLVPPYVAAAALLDLAWAVGPDHAEGSEHGCALRQGCQARLGLATPPGKRRVAQRVAVLLMLLPQRELLKPAVKRGREGEG